MAPPVCHFMERREGAFGVLDSVPFCLFFSVFIVLCLKTEFFLVDDKFKEFKRLDCQTEIYMFVKILCVNFFCLVIWRQFRFWLACILIMFLSL